MKLRLILSSMITALLTAVITTTTFALPVSAYTNYVALGDSVASGAGLGANLDTVCDRSSLAYPTLIAKHLGTTVNNLACSGAKVDEGLYGVQGRGEVNIPAQIYTAFENGSPDLVTITIGANDIRWANSVRDCYIFECGSRLDKARAVVYRADLRLELYQALSLIKHLSGGIPPTVLINGYYNPFPSAAVQCELTAEISEAEVAWLAEQKSYLNHSLKTVASYFDFAKYVPVNFAGHKLCANDPWIQGPNDPAPLHPNSAGQQAIAQNILRVLRR